MLFSISSAQTPNFNPTQPLFASIYRIVLHVQSLESQCWNIPGPSEWVRTVQVEAFQYFKTLTLLSGTLIPRPRLVLLNSHGHSKCNVDTGAIDPNTHNGKAKYEVSKQGQQTIAEITGGGKLILSKNKVCKESLNKFFYRQFSVSRSDCDRRRFTQVHKCNLR